DRSGDGAGARPIGGDGFAPASGPGNSPDPRPCRSEARGAAQRPRAAADDRRVHGAAAILPGAPRPLSVPLIGVQRARARARPRVRGGESARGGARCALQLRGRRRRWQPTNAVRRAAGLLLLQLWWPTRLELRGRVALVVPGSGRRAAWVQAEESRVARGGDEGAVDMTAPHHPLEILPEAVA